MQKLGGGASTCDAFHITAPHENASGASEAMKKAIEESDLASSEVDYIHAHGTSTLLNDQKETLAIKNTFGKRAYDLLISSTKSMTGHMISAAGPFGVLVLCLAINKHQIPPTINLKQPDLPSCDLNYVPGEKSIKKKIRVGISNAFGFGGHNACLLVKKYV